MLSVDLAMAGYEVTILSAKVEVRNLVRTATRSLRYRYKRLSLQGDIFKIYFLAEQWLQSGDWLSMLSKRGTVAPPIFNSTRLQLFYSGPRNC